MFVGDISNVCIDNTECNREKTTDTDQCEIPPKEAMRKRQAKTIAKRNLHWTEFHQRNWTACEENCDE